MKFFVKKCLFRDFSEKFCYFYYEGLRDWITER